MKMSKVITQPQRVTHLTQLSQVSILKTGLLFFLKKNAGPDSYENKRFHCNYFFICLSCFLRQGLDALKIATTDHM